MSNSIIRKVLPLILVGLIVISFGVWKTYQYINEPNRVFIKALNNWDLEGIKSAAARGANLDTFVNNARPLYAAFQEGRYDFMQVLSDSGAILNLVDGTTKVSMIAEAYNNRDWKAFEILAKGGASFQYKADTMGHTILTAAVAANDTAWLPIILEYADINKSDNNGRLPIHYITSVKMVNYLLKEGAKINDTDKNGNTALHLVYELDLIKAIVKHGGKVNKKNNCGVSPLHFQVANGTAENYTYLVKRGAKVLSKDAQSNDVIYYAWLNDSPSVRKAVEKDVKRRYPNSWVKSKEAIKKTDLYQAVISYDGDYSFSEPSYKRSTISKTNSSANIGMILPWLVRAALRSTAIQGATRSYSSSSSGINWTARRERKEQVQNELKQELLSCS